MDSKKPQFLDAHMHLWDMAENAWYPNPEVGDNSFGMALPQAFPQRYLLEEYRGSLAAVEPVGCVHVTAVADPVNVEAESAWVAALAASGGLPTALVGTLAPALPAAQVEALLDREMRCPAYRGIRLLGGIDYASPGADRLLRALAARSLVYDAVAFPGGGISALAAGLARHPELLVVLEHTGWPVGGRDPGVFAQWRREMATLAELPNVYCKLSGLAMALHSIDAALFLPWHEECLALFGSGRCMFATNFPVDLCYGSATALFEVFADFARQLSADESADLYRRTAQRIYRPPLITV